MNLVIIRHTEDNGKYLFALPNGKKLNAGDTVLVQNKRGERVGVCLCDSFIVETDSDTLRGIEIAMGAKEPLATIVGRYTLERWS